MYMFSFSLPELVLILVIALVVFGPSKLPEVGKALGKSLQEFKKATGNLEDAANEKEDNVKNESIKSKEKDGK